MIIRAAFASRARPGESRNGDAAFVRREGETLLFAVLDGLGHGPPAAAASDAGVEYLASVDLGQRLRDIVAGLDRHLASTRGAAAVIGVVRTDALEACSISNVELRSHGVSVPVVLTPGLLGRRPRKLHPYAATLGLGSRLLVFTDGMGTGPELVDVAGHAPQDACQALLTQHALAHDDATVMMLEATDSQ